MEPSSPFVKDYLGLTGQKLGPYVVRQIVGMGGVAVIYRGEHETLHGSVAIKVLTPEVVKDEVRPTLEAMFLREAQILSQLRSEDILRAHHHGRVVCPGDGRERPYLVVDWLEGRTLAEELELRRRPRRPYSLAELVELLDPIARALDVAHAAGIVHRDVNPRNVFLEDRGPGRLPRARLIDFGFAKEVQQTQALHLQHVTGTLLARSPDYAAPEHYDRETYGELSENTDIYTFALLLVETLTLEPPLRGTTPEALFFSTADRQDRPTPNKRGARVSAEVEKLFTDALAVDQFERPGVILGWWEALKQAAARPEHPDARPHGSMSTAPGYAPPTAFSAPPPIPPRGARPPAGPPQVQPPHMAPPAQAMPPPRQKLSPEPELRPAGVPKRGVAATVMIVLLVLVAGGAAAGYAIWLGRPLECPSGFADCNGERGDGCEVELKSNASHCGSCQNACAGEQGSVGCVSGKCSISRCPEPSHGDCNADAKDGCETLLSSDPQHCGACGQACGADGTKKVACAAGKCELSCKAGRGDCDAKPDNGCETELATNAKHCGRCDLECVQTSCSDGACLPKAFLSAEGAERLAARSGELIYWDSKQKRIIAVSPSGQPRTLVEGADAVTGLAVGADQVVWATGERATIFAQALSGGPARRVAGPLASSTPLVLTGEWLSWVNRSPRVATLKPKGAKRPAGVPLPPGPHDVVTAKLDASLGTEEPRSNACPSWPAIFTGDDQQQLCCDEGQALNAVECQGQVCKPRRYFIACPRLLVLDQEHGYFAYDVKISAFSRRSGEVRQLVRRQRKAAEIAVDDRYVYFIEEAELYRVKKAPTAGAVSAELMARAQHAPHLLTAEASGVYWAAGEPSKAQLVGLLKPP